MSIDVHPVAVKLQEARERLILALDFPSVHATKQFLSEFRGTAPNDLSPRWVKVGLELFLAGGPSFVGHLVGEGYRVFLDLKLHDIPNTVAGAIRAILPLEPALLTVHASGGASMLAAAAEAAAGSSTRLLAVTVLTSLDADQLAATGVSGEPSEQVLRLAHLASGAGIEGFVCSPLEAQALREAVPAAHLVTPGIRSAGGDRGDQQRVSTPAQAIRSGAAQVVIGRPITQAENPVAAFNTILHEIAEAL